MPIDIKSLDCFSIGEDPKSVGTRWKQWIGSFEINLEALGKVDKKQQKALLLHTAGKEVQEVFKTLNLTNERVIEGSISQELQKQLLQVKKLTLQKVLEIARALEMVNYQSKVIAGKAQNDSLLPPNNCKRHSHLTSQCKFAKQKTTKHINRTVNSNDSSSSNEDSVAYIRQQK
ncbi:uncharacterized protein [Macrobrachium rosenbergii]|uniref:uncharacterized protein n=1 Tax=Macrobrachium rosenbergii TaxID=79674 RepID=UPI0034D67219